MGTSTRRLFLASAAAALAAGGGQNAVGAQAAAGGEEDTVPLASLPVVALTGPVRIEKKAFSVSGIVSDSGFCAANGAAGVAVVDLMGRFRSLEAVFGVSDTVAITRERDSPYSVTLDGRLICAGTARKDGKPVRVSLNVTGGRSLRIALANGGAVGNPAVGAREVAAEVGGLEASDRPTLLSPAHRARGVAAPVTLRWKPMPKAAGYAVQVVLRKRLGKPASPDVRIWAFTVAGEAAEYAWDMRDTPSGEYAWSVLAFDGEGQVGTFSDERTFTMAR